MNEPLHGMNVKISDEFYITPHWPFRHCTENMFPRMRYVKIHGTSHKIRLTIDTPRKLIVVITETVYLQNLA